MAEHSEERTSPLAGTTWAYPNAGFWIVHVIGVVVVGYLGYYIMAGMR